MYYSIYKEVKYNGKRDDERRALAQAQEDDGMQDAYFRYSYLRKCLLAHVDMACIYRMDCSISRNREVANALL